jgi:hypothetical protein
MDIKLPLHREKLFQASAKVMTQQKIEIVALTSI